MDHAAAQARMNDYFSGRLDRAAVRELHQHFKDCDACRANLRLRRAAARHPAEGAAALDAIPGLHESVARNRDLLVKILILMVFAWFVWKWKR